MLNMQKIHNEGENITDYEENYQLKKLQLKKEFDLISKEKQLEKKINPENINKIKV